MRNWFRSLPIRSKLVVTTAASTSAALLLAGGGFLAWDIVTFGTLIERDLAAQLRVLSENAAPALVFDDDRAAGETLAALELQPHMVMACLYAPDGRLFATYHRDAVNRCPPMSAIRPASGWRDARLVTAIAYAGSRVGTLFIYRDLDDVRERMMVGLAIVAALVLMCGVVALWVGSLLQRSIVNPMLELARVARRVSDERHVSTRVTPPSEDEVGVVMHAFNDMLDRIADRTAALSQANVDLQREIEERRRIEGERTALLARERDANRLKDEFLATLSHELRTPLNAVLGWIRVLRTTAVDEDTQHRALETIERNARAQARLIEDLLEVSRIVTGKLRLHVRPADLAAILDSAIEIVQPAAAAKRIALRVHVEARPAMTVGDPDRLQQIMWNLVSNAVKFTPPGGEVRIALRRRNGYVLTVTDTGAGIDPVFLPHVFEPFRQADGSASREHGGLGLGLAIVRQLVEMHGGTVRADSAGRGAGATFEVQLPLEAAAQSVTREEAPAFQATGSTARPLEGIRILVVDDDPDALDLMGTMLAAQGAVVQTAASADDALQLLEQGVPDVLVSDIGMPFEDGYALIKRVRSRSAGHGGLVPAIALTAYASPSDRLAALAAGYQAHVSKPYEPSAVIALVGSLAKGTATEG